VLVVVIGGAVAHRDAARAVYVAADEAAAADALERELR
jgi:hypothetical protein